ncbi:MAG: hypothetical protein DCC57_14035 [Chloroflexi bacterium]|nr:MAG: hypothetical protein DCC57_14035 [Chloroflexota bacterium]
MELHEYPRPANDTGIGVHWTAGFASAIGIGRIRDHWLPEMKAMGIKWVKIFNHDGAIDFAELLLSEGIMPCPPTASTWWWRTPSPTWS